HSFYYNGAISFLIFLKKTTKKLGAIPSFWDSPYQIEKDLVYSEGAKRLITHMSRERDQRVIKAAIRKAKRLYGKVICEICNFDFEQMYGNRGLDYIEGHHKLPISKRDDVGDITKVEDIALVCANCHRIIHRERDNWLSIEEMKKIIKRKWNE
ncbi:HNH endonuclease, partial [Paenactinomyces guangxiensis]